ncbi:Bardet-Biedl syndrome 7 protein homolog-like Protein [Tribolium castaneum]|uniref:Bardet-Biedl syndrome 7 protein homolog-like Protein n=1 Tax=Tribolium castaneum TaxID=7070 RepID=D2A192_TRICA|nr:PREDICTED: Bardet-Biedl syndrome 7 protein homolog [Tribolium castaneum]EFA01565.1 Bardet-Biedl syndrome 7 protein homolog-like Protein [Tribolium castaneum]|eukprot:XP_008192487.2 PREDICTED: Bardet-Biedl syndrome 7 protein homolog [Tribolium castaneum]
MELELSRVDYTIVGITSQNCLKLLPPSASKEPQKVAVADSDGILQIFSVKKEDIQLHFKTLPGPKISSLQLGGAHGSSSDKIFIAAENEIRGYTKKGKLFLTFDPGMTEPVSSMFVLGNDLFLCGKHIYNHFRDCKDVGSYLCGDQIVDVIAFFADKTRRLMSLIACEGRMIRALEHARVTMSMEVESAPTLLHVLEQDGTKTVLFGTVDGRIGILDVEKLHGFDRWLIDNSSNSSTISCVDSYDMTSSGTKNLILGRQDGTIEVYVINVNDNLDAPILIYSHNCNESVSSLQCGVIGTQGFDEVLVVTYTGRIFGLTTEAVDKSVADNTMGNYIFSQDTGNKINKLKSEIEDLQVKVAKEREKYQNSTQSFFEELSAIPLLSVKDSFVLSKDTATYTLTLEVPTAIDNILLQSNVAIDLLDVEKNSAVISYSDADHAIGNFLLATYRCQVNTNRLEIKIRTIEGQHGLLHAYVTPLVQPKCSRLIQFEIKPLSLHYRIHKFDESRLFNTLTMTGTFSLAEMHTWVSQSLPEVPEKPQFGENTVLCFQSTFFGTILQCSYQKGEAFFKSDNVSTISILKEFLTVEATKKKIKISISSNINDESINHVIKLIEPKLIKQKDLNNDIKLLNALNELEVTEEENRTCLSEKYRNLLANEKELRREFQSQPDYLDRLYGIVTDLYIDYNKFKGCNVKSKLATLREILDEYSYDALIQFFRPELSK